MSMWRREFVKRTDKHAAGKQHVSGSFPNLKSRQYMMQGSGDLRCKWGRTVNEACIENEE